MKRINNKDNTVPEIGKYSPIMRSMSHEMRTHMTSIVSLAFLLKDNFSEAKKNELFNYIHQTCKQLIIVFENFAELEYSDSRNIKKEEEKCSITNFLAPLFDEFRAHLITGGKQRVELINEIQNIDLHEVIIDKTNVYKILRCLFFNSFHNTEFGYIKIGFYIKNDGNMTFYVRDSGNSYEKTREFLNSKDINSSLNLFKDFYSAVNIFLAKKLVQALHGVIDINYNGTDGSEVYFTIPIKNIDTPKPSLYKYFKNL